VLCFDGKERERECWKGNVCVWLPIKWVGQYVLSGGKNRARTINSQVLTRAPKTKQFIFFFEKRARADGKRLLSS
jgi:hypothetical protein